MILSSEQHANDSGESSARGDGRPCAITTLPTTNATTVPPFLLPFTTMPAPAPTPAEDTLGDEGADKPPVDPIITPTQTNINQSPSRIALPAPQPSGWSVPANINALRASDATNGAYSPSVLASGASSPAPETTATPRANPARRPSRGAAAAGKLTGANAFKRMFGSGSGANTPVTPSAVASAVSVAPTPPLATRTQSTETTQDSLLSKHPPPTPDSESETTSERFRSNPPSRAQSFSSEVRPAVRNPPGSRPPSVSGQSDGHKFNLKDLLASAPKQGRKSSTGGSRKSDAGSEHGGKSGGSVSSNGQLKHYGTCERVAIGKGATSIVKLAHKWDRTEEKLYAVKVSAFLLFSALAHSHSL